MCLDIILKKDVHTNHAWSILHFIQVYIYSVTDTSSNTICDHDKDLLVTLIILQDCGTGLLPRSTPVTTPTHASCTVSTAE